MGLGTWPFVTCCYSDGYRADSSKPALFREGWEPLVLQVIDNQLSINSAVPSPVYRPEKSLPKK